MQYKPFTQALMDANTPAPQAIDAASSHARDNRFNIYRNNIMVSLTESLTLSFNVTAQLTGLAFFQAMAREFIRTHLPNSAILVNYGDQLPAFIRHFPPAASLPYLPDMAQFEYLWLQSCHSADSTPITAETLAYWLDKPEQLSECRLVLAPAMRLFSSHFAIDQIWLAHQPHSLHALRDIDLNQPTYLLLSRPALDVELHPLSAAQFQLLNALQQGLSLSTALERAPDADLNALFARLIEQRLILAIAPINSEQE